LTENNATQTNKFIDFLNNKKTQILFLSLIFIIGFITSFGYGSYLDEKSEKEILYSNILEYTNHIAPNSSLANDFKTNGIIPISESIEKDHGTALYYPVWFIYLIEKDNINLGSAIWHAYTFFLVFLGMLCLYFLVKEMYKDTPVAMAAVLLFWLTPRMFAESHYNNKDMVLLSTVFMIMYFGYRVAKKCEWRDVILFALSGAFAMNTKIVGAWPFGVMGIYAFFNLLFHKKLNIKTLIKTASCIVLWILFFILLTPASFDGIIKFFAYLLTFALDFNRWNDYVLYNGIMLYHNVTGTPHKYLLRMIGITTPTVHLFLLAIGTGLTAAGLFTNKDEKRARSIEIIVFTLCGAVPLAFAVISGTRVYNGWRHFYFVYPSLILLMVHGLIGIHRYLKKRKLAAVIPIATGFYLLNCALGIGANYPQEHSFYNMLAGKNIEERFELDYWDLSIEEALNTILEREEKEFSVGCLNNPTLWGIERNYDRLINLDKLRITIKEDYKEADYVIVNTTYAVMYSKESYEALKKDHTLIKEIKSYGNTICEVYKK
jgi:hypothetical protein